MTKMTRITMFTLGGTLVGALLLGATPAVAGDATEDADTFDAETEQAQPAAPLMAAAPTGIDKDSLGSAGGEPSRADARHHTPAKQDGDRNDWDEHEFQQQVWTAP